jgi:hypothetical protein
MRQHAATYIASTAFLTDTLSTAPIGAPLKKLDEWLLRRVAITPGDLRKELTRLFGGPLASVLASPSLREQDWLLAEGVNVTNSS